METTPLSNCTIVTTSATTAQAGYPAGCCLATAAAIIILILRALCREEGAKAEHLKAVGKLPHARLHAKALDIADDYLRVQKGVKGAAGEAAKAQTAADAAAAINNMPRCRKCEACINNMTSSTRRRCLRVRAFAAAAGGHTGAQVAAMEGTAKGARLEVCYCCSIDASGNPLTL